jgi:hypothetical protein
MLGFLRDRATPAGWVGFLLAPLLSGIFSALVMPDEKGLTGAVLKGAVLPAVVLVLLVALGVALAALRDAVAAIGPPVPKVIHATRSRPEFPTGKLILTLDQAGPWDHRDKVELLLEERDHDRWLGAGEIVAIRDRRPVVVVTQTSPDLDEVVKAIGHGGRLSDLVIVDHGVFSLPRVGAGGEETSKTTQQQPHAAIFPVSGSAGDGKAGLQ